MRHLLAFALLLTPGVSLANWTPVDFVSSYVSCRQAGGSYAICGCAVEQLMQIHPTSPTAEPVTKDEIKTAVQACVPAPASVQHI